MSLAASVMLWAGCSGRVVSSTDQGERPPDRGTALESPTPLDTDVPIAIEAGVLLPDQGGGLAKGPNTGKVCDLTAATPCTGADECIGLQFTGWPSNKGVCVSRCSANVDCAKQTGQATACGVKDATSGKMWCIFLCEYSGASYTCPDAASSQCLAGTTPGVKICGPKP